MNIRKLRLINFRNYENLKLEFPAMINVFFGSNGQGKTNILESIFFSAFGFSHRLAREEDLVRFGNDGYSCAVEFDKGDILHTVCLKKYTKEKKRKEIILDEKRTTTKNHYGFLSAVMFSPEDLMLVKGDPQIRRRYIDMEISQTDLVYYDLLLQYNKNLRQRNQLLKNIKDGKAEKLQLEPWDDEFSRLASAIVKKRIENITRLEKICQEILKKLSQEKDELSIHYVMKVNGGEEELSGNYPEKEKFADMIRNRQEKDIMLGYTGIGPHRDDIRIYINGYEGKYFASQGQQRCCALSLKLSQLLYVQEKRGEFPVLLLDDVMSELDNERREQLLKFIDGRVQTFITVNERKVIPEISGTDYFLVCGGKVMKN